MSIFIAIKDSIIFNASFFGLFLGLFQLPINISYGIVLIIDEVMSGFGRTGKWFGIEHSGINPDIIVMAKGMTSGYLPLGAAVVNDKVSSYFDKNALIGGLTYSAHAMSCAAAIACINVYKEDRLIEHTAQMGPIVKKKLQTLQEKHPSIGEFRGIGLFWVLEIVKNRKTREPASPWNKPYSPEMAQLAADLRKNGLSTFVRWNMIFIVPPLCITEKEFDEGLNIISNALQITDKTMNE